MRKILRWLTCLAFFGLGNAGLAQTVSDSDWSEPLKVSCGLPNAAAMEKVDVDGDVYIRLKLKDGYTGKCPTDIKPRGVALTRERMELAQTERWMRLGNTYDISFSVIFEEGFTSRGETIFQIHGYAAKCNAPPMFHMGFSKGQFTAYGLVSIDEQTLKGRYEQIANYRPNVTELYNEPLEFEIEAGIANRGRIMVRMNGKTVVESQLMTTASCAEPYVKVGVYRVGPASDPTKRVPLGISSALFDDIQIKERPKSSDR